MATPEELVLLGEGPVATVYAGVRPDTGEAFALKVFPAKLPKRTRAELDRELTRLAALRDRAPILVPEAVLDTPEGRTALRMELCSQSLRELIASCGKLTVPDALALGRAVATALSAAHEAGLVHGGVTPDNLLFRPTGEPVLADLGLTLRRAYPRDERTGLDFAAPETLRDGTINERSDLYGLGTLLYLALSGESPHPGAIGEPEGERMLRVLGTPVPPLSREDVPEALAAVVSALLSKDPELRPAEASVVAGWLGRLSRGEPKAAAPAPQGRGFDDFAGQLPHPAPAPPPGPRSRGPRPSGPHTPPPPPVLRPPAPRPAAPAGPPAPAPGGPRPPAAHSTPPGGLPSSAPGGPHRPAAAHSTPPGSLPAPTSPATPAPSGPHHPVPAHSTPSGNLPAATGPRPPASTAHGTPPGGLPAPTPRDPDSPRPAGAPLVISGPPKPDRPATRTGLILGGVGVAAVLAVGAVLLIRDDPTELAVPPGPAPAGASTAPTTSAKPVEIFLEEPVLRGNVIELNWRSSEPLTFSVTVAPENEENKSYAAFGNLSWKGNVDPARRYCFEVRGTNSRGFFYQSQTRSLNGAPCAR